MLDVPYVKSPAKNACALACHLMVAKTFFPETTTEELKSVLRWRDGYIVWSFPFWLWLAGKGLHIKDSDTVPYREWATEGFEVLQNTFSAETMNYWRKNTLDLDGYRDDIRRLFSLENFIYHQQAPEIDDVRKALVGKAVCEVTLGSNALNNEPGGLAIHRIVVLEVTDKQIIFHDPATPADEDRPRRVESIDTFMKAWPKEIRELCVYEKPD